MTFGWNAPDSLEVVARRPALGLRSGWLGLALVLGLGGCAVQWQNARAAQEVAKKSEPPGSVYAGWRVFQDRCAACHGADAPAWGEGADGGPEIANHRTNNPITP